MKNIFFTCDKGKIVKNKAQYFLRKENQDGPTMLHVTDVTGHWKGKGHLRELGMLQCLKNKA